MEDGIVCEFYSADFLTCHRMRAYELHIPANDFLNGFYNTCFHGAYICNQSTGLEIFLIGGYPVYRHIWI